jgi:hypothetical protein
MADTLYVLAPQAYLPDQKGPQEATIEVDLSSRKFTSIRHGLHPPPPESRVIKVDPSHVLLPGLIEWALHLLS